MSNKGIRLVLGVVLFLFILLGAYFINEVKKIESYYEQMAEDIINNY